MALDLSTLYLVATLVAALLGGMLLYFGREEKIPALNWWGCAYLLGAASVALWVVIGPVIGEPLRLLVLALGLIACGMVWNAARVFHGRRPHWPGLFIGTLVWIAAVTGLAPEDGELRLTVGAAIVAAYAVLTASQLGSERRKSMRRRWLTIVVPTLHGAVLMLPILLAELTRTDNEAMTASFWVSVFAMELVLYAVGTVFVIFMLVSERTVRAHKAAASLDPLTGMFNRRGFAEATARMIEREGAAGRPVAVLIFDIDHFKSINDRFGHPAGDEMLKLFSVIVSSTLRISDLCGRIGGEEFAAMLPCSVDEAVVAAERVREAFEHCGIEVDDGPVATTVSIGVAGGPPRTELDVLLAAADTALYQAKRSGRNRVLAASEPPPSLDGERVKAAAAAHRPAIVGDVAVAGA
jgi:diguanylate cyclase (GGDEF)-like protein